MSERFKFWVQADGCAVRFAILEQPGTWRGGLGKTLKRTMPSGVEIFSESCTYLDYFGKSLTIYLRGSRRDLDHQFLTIHCESSCKAEEVSERIRDALLEFSVTGGFRTVSRPTSITTDNITTVEIPT